MTVKFYLHEIESYKSAGAYDSINRAYSHLGGCDFQNKPGFEDKKEDDFVVDQVLEDGESKHFLFYHVTPTENLGSIMEKGLIPQLGERSKLYGEKRAGVFVFPLIAECEGAMDNWLGEEFEGECACDDKECEGDCQDIPVSYLELKLPYVEYLHSIACDVGYERTILKTISPEYITVLDEK